MEGTYKIVFGGQTFNVSLSDDFILHLYIFTLSSITCLLFMLILILTTQSYTVSRKSFILSTHGVCLNAGPHKSCSYALKLCVNYIVPLVKAVAIAEIGREQ